MKLNKPAFVFLFFVLFITSCSLQERRYRSGFTLTKNHKTVKSKSQLNSAPNNFIQNEIISNGLNSSITASSNNDPDLILKKNPEDSCVIIEFKDKREVRATLVLLNPSTIKYRKCGITNGMVFDESIKDVISITYANGTIKEFHHTPKSKENRPSTTSVRVVTEETKAKRGYDFASAANTYSTFGLLPGVGIIFCIMSIIFGAIALNKINNNEENSFLNEDDAKKGLIRGIVFFFVNITISFVTGLFLILMAASAFS